MTSDTRDMRAGDMQGGAMLAAAFALFTMLPAALLTMLPTAGRAEPLSLSAAVQQALDHAPAVRAAEAGRDAAAEDKALGRAWLLPYVELSGSVQRRRHHTAYDVPQALFKNDLNYNENTVGLRVVQTLFDLGRWAGYRQGQLSAEAGELKLRLERQRLMLETARAFLDAGTAEAVLKAATAREQAAASLAAQAEAAQRVGIGAGPERLDAEARRDLAAADRLQAENDLDQARARLASLTGRAVDVLQFPGLAANLASPGNGQADDVVTRTWEDRAAGDAIAVKLSEVQFGVARQGERKALGGALPKIEAFGEVARDRSGDTILNRGVTVRDAAIGVQLKMPLYAGGGIRAQMRKSEKQAVEAQFALDDDVRLARLTARQSLLSLQSAAARVNAMRAAVVSARLAAQAAHKGFDVGLRSITDVLDADERGFAAEKSLAAARAQYVFAELQLRASVGELAGKPLPAVFGTGHWQAARNYMRASNQP